METVRRSVDVKGSQERRVEWVEHGAFLEQ